MSTENESFKEEIRREFQLERMILFSDAVFAIVITLMAIEIHVPEVRSIRTSEELVHELVHLLPMIIGYTVSFVFIGITWYQHLQLFGLLKDYDQGLVTRNLILLFFIGLFPFSAAVMAHPSESMSKVILYFSIIVLCKSAQLYLQHYILFKKPNLRINASIQAELIRYRKSRLAVAMLISLSFLVFLSYMFLDDEFNRRYVWWIFVPFPFLMKYFQKKIK